MIKDTQKQKAQDSGGDQEDEEESWDDEMVISLRNAMGAEVRGVVEREMIDWPKPSGNQTWWRLKEDIWNLNLDQAAGVLESGLRSSDA